MNHQQYFRRTTVYKVEGNTVSLVDVHENNTVTPIDPWMGAVVTLADGEHTIDQLVRHMAAQYANGAPDNLVETIESVLKRLVDVGVVELSAESHKLPYYLSLPLDEQDPKLATKLMINDGFLSST